MRFIHWFLICLTPLALGVAFKLGQHIERQNELSKVRICAEYMDTTTYDASQYAPEAFEETNQHFRKAIEHGDYPKEISLICAYPTGLGASTIVVAGNNLPHDVCEAIFEEVKKSLHRYPRIPRFDLDEVLSPSEDSKNAEQAGTEQPATRPESKSEDDDKPQPEAEGGSR
jgi:hypothetical protein